MNYFFKITIICTAVALSAASCDKKEDRTQADASVMADEQELAAEVDTLTVRKKAFESDILSNGRVKASKFADVYFRSPELISEVMVRNGQRVRKGQALAQLDLFKLNAEKTRQEAALAKAQLDLKDALIGQGYNPDDMGAVPAEVMALVRVRSGLDQAEASYHSALKDIENATLKAPFDGVVANMKGMRHTMASTGEPFCRIINDNSMSVEFPILESELPLLQQGETVEVTPYSSAEKYYGRVTEINPMVDESGHIAVKATLTGGTHGLIDGVNVRIRSSHNLGDRLIIPKSALVLRTGRQVVFTYENGKAMWNYVTTGLENLDSYEISEGLNEGDTVIFSGNENLAHETPVVIKPVRD